MRKTPTATTSRIYLDSFSGAAADLPPSKRTPGHALRALARDTRVSTFDMSESCWLRGCIDALVQLEYIKPDPAEPYPWHRYTITDKGRERLEALA